MHVYSLAICGLLFVGAVIASNEFDATQFNTNLFEVDSNAAIDSPYWWMSKGSPFKRSYDAAASAPQNQRFDFANNPFMQRAASAKLFSGPGYLPPQETQNTNNVYQTSPAPPPPPPPPPTRPPTIPCNGNGRVCVPNYLCNNGVVDASQVNGANSQQCNVVNNEVCCTVRSPPPPPPTRSNEYIPPPPPTAPPASPCYDRNSVCVPSYQCNNGVVPRGSPLASSRPASSCRQPEVCCRIPEELPSPSTARPVVVTQRPFIPPPTQKVYPGNQYIPPQRDNEVQPGGNNPVPSYLPPQTGEDEKSYPTNRDESVLRPDTGEDQKAPNILPPAQCPAATNCTEIEFCGADGFISKTPVILTDQQQAFRVPLTDCRDLSRGITGKCCRDADYTDPWPTSLLVNGQYDANVLGAAFDDGQYKGPNGRQNSATNGPSGPIRGNAILSQPIQPISSQSTNTQFSRTPFPTNTVQYTQAPYNPNAIPNGNKPYVQSPFVPNNPNVLNQKPFVPQPPTPPSPNSFTSQPKYPSKTYQQNPITQQPNYSQQQFSRPQQPLQQQNYPQQSPKQQSYRPQQQQQTYTQSPQPQQQNNRPAQEQQTYTQTPQPQQQSYRPQQQQQTYTQTPQSQQQSYRPQPQQQTYTQTPQSQQQSYRPEQQQLTYTQTQQPQKQNYRPAQQQQTYTQTPQPQQQNNRPAQEQQTYTQTPQQQTQSYRPQQQQQTYTQSPQPQQQNNRPAQEQQSYTHTPQQQQQSYRPAQQQQTYTQTPQPQQQNNRPAQEQQTYTQTPQPQQQNYRPGQLQQTYTQTPQPQQQSYRPQQQQQTYTQSPQQQQQQQNYRPAQQHQNYPQTSQQQPQRKPFIQQQQFVSQQPQNPLLRPQGAQGVCGVRDNQAEPRGPGPNDGGFGEFPWQAMILRESTKSILCGGAIIEGNLVATAAHCVQGLRTHDILIKAGEWKLGSTEEPKPFQTKRVVKITMHPAYQPTNLESDVALLHLESNLNFDRHIGPICIDENELEPAGSSNEECLTTGWGKEIIKHHVANSVPKSVPIYPLPPHECSSAFGNFNANSAVCGRADNNICDADAGSALACTRGDGKYLLKGIYSSESGCGINQYATFTKMDVQFLKGGQPGVRQNLDDRSSYQDQESHSIPSAQPTASYTQASTSAPYAYPVPSTQAPEYLPPNK